MHLALRQHVDISWQLLSHPQQLASCQQLLLVHPAKHLHLSKKKGLVRLDKSKRMQQCHLVVVILLVGVHITFPLLSEVVPAVGMAGLRGMEQGQCGATVQQNTVPWLTLSLVQVLGLALLLLLLLLLCEDIASPGTTACCSKTRAVAFPTAALLTWLLAGHHSLCDNTAAAAAITATAV
jgi:hypothetical protein